LLPCCPPQEEYGDLYSADNVVLTASHTHGSAGGFMEYFLYHITSWGFVKQSFDALVDGIMEVRQLLGVSRQTLPTSFRASKT
jgi:hypothetical protein